ncbi:MAG: bifunctional phosphoribosylaminoimidazolecarboxamide formyltransferase/IMP cyclohydrolase [Bacteroidota bacterium]
MKVSRALISVSDKTGIVEFAKALEDLGVEIISTGGTQALLREHSVDARAVSEVTHFPEILDGRVKTLHPKILGAILGKTDDPDHQRQMQEFEIEPIDLLVVNLYPFEETIQRNNVTLDAALEQIDIGGPTMLRAAAKNYKWKAVVTDPARYDEILAELRQNDGNLSEKTCFALAQEVFRHTSHYDSVIAGFLSGRNGSEESVLPSQFTIHLPKTASLRYGENPHQAAALYGDFDKYFEKLHGKELSFNNILDINAAASLAAEFDQPVAVIMKHTNPCGVGVDGTLSEAYRKALATDSKSAFGGIVAVNRPLDMETATKINEIFTEVIVAPDYLSDVLDFLKRKKDRRLIREGAGFRSSKEFDVRKVAGGFLVQQPDVDNLTREQFSVVTKRKPTDEETEGLLFAWKVVKHVKSNAIVYARFDRTLGIGAGQMSRVDSSKIAAMKAAEAGLNLKGSAVASDAFFPFADGLLEAVKVGATAVIQPGGSVRDEEVIKAADEHGVAMVFTGIRHFKH